MNKTYSTHVITMPSTVGFFADRAEAEKIQAKKSERTLAVRYFTLDGSVPVPSDAIVASFDQVEAHCEIENYKQTCLNFH